MLNVTSVCAPERGDNCKTCSRLMMIERDKAQKGGDGRCAARRLSVMCISSLSLAALHRRT
ncbi:hypothetical protein D3C71_1921580 [compost metagenome]